MTNTETVTLWQIGRKIESVEIEPKQGKWFAEYNYTLEIDSDPIDNPKIPQLIAIPRTSQGQSETFSTGKLNIYFTLDRNYRADELTLFYGCFGSQSTRLYLDGQLLTPVLESTTAELQRMEIPVPATTVGDHILTITVSGKQQDADYQVINYLKLETLPGEDVTLYPVSDDFQSLNIWNIYS